MPYNLGGFRCCPRSWLIAGAVIASMPLAARSLPLQAQNSEMPRGEKHESRLEIDQLEDKWRDAILKSDAATMQTLLADDYTGITAYGTLQSKEETLSSLRSGRLHITTMDLSDRKVRFYGGTALVTSSAFVQGVTPDGDVTGNYRYSHVYVRDPQGDWKIVNFESSRVHRPHPPRPPR
jgi:ketosteroid isomerase-like protein